ncbi:MAG TPA: DUF5678 domain-containing protein [Acidimicrobiia bacterium]|jgi:hypothetical protein
MPDHDTSPEDRWLRDRYAGLSDFDGRWIAVVDEEIVDYDEDPEALALRVTAERGMGVALFAAVVHDVIG